MATQRSNTKTTATELLRSQHDTVKQMFSDMANARGRDREDLFDCLRKTLAVHETAEEMVVYPEVRTMNKAAERVVEARLKEESEAKTVLAQLEKLGPNDERFDQLFETFRQSVLQHASAEETQVFPFLDDNLAGAKLIEMAELIETAEAMAPTHPHPHGPESAMGNLLVGPFVAMVDKVRDKVAEHQKKK